MFYFPGASLFLMLLNNINMNETYEYLTDKLEPKLKTKTQQEQPKQHWIGVAGGPGSGKTTISEIIAGRLNQIEPESAVVVPMDGWHTPQRDLIAKFGPESMKRRGAPWTFDVELCVEELKKAKQAGEGSLPIYSREISDPLPDGVSLQKHHRVVLVEGLYLLWKEDPQWSKLFDLWDERWFVQCPSRQEQIDRLVQRSVQTWTDAKTKQWGPGAEGARKRAECNDVPNMDTVAPCHRYADEVIINN